MPHARRPSSEATHGRADEMTDRKKDCHHVLSDCAGRNGWSLVPRSTPAIFRQPAGLGEWHDAHQDCEPRTARHIMHFMKSKRPTKSKAIQPATPPAFDGLLRSLREFITESRRQVLRLYYERLLSSKDRKRTHFHDSKTQTHRSPFLLLRRNVSERQPCCRYARCRRLSARAWPRRLRALSSARAPG